MAPKNKHHQQRSHDNTREKNRYEHPERIGGVLVLLATAACVVGYMLSLDMRHRRKAVVVFFIAWVLLGLAIAIPLWLQYGAPNVSRPKEPEPPSEGPPVEQPIAKKPRFSEKVDRVTVIFGADNFSFRNEEGKKTALLVIGNKKAKLRREIVTAKVSNGQLLVDADLPGSIQLHDNQLSSRPPGWDRNFDDSAIEVVNEQGVPIFQLKYINEHTAVVDGVFVVGDVVYVVTESSININPSPEKLFRLPPIFKYPSWKHQGERN